MAKRWFILIGIILFAFILLNIDVGKVLTHLSEANLSLIFLAIIVVFFITILKGIKWKLLVNAHELNFSTIDCIKTFCIGFFLGVVTPGRIGDFSRAAYLKKKGNSFFQGISSIVFDRIIDIAILLVLSIVAVFVFAQFFHKDIISLPLLAIIFVIFIAVCIIALKKNLSRIFLKPLAFLIPMQYKSLIKNSMDSFYNGVAKAKQKKLLIILAAFIGIVTWLLSIFGAFLVLIALNIQQIPMLFVFVIVPIITLLEILPISFSGIGTRDAALVFLFSFFGASAEQAVAYSLIYLFSGYFFVALLGAIFFMQNPISMKELKMENKNETN